MWDNIQERSMQMYRACSAPQARVWFERLLAPTRTLADKAWPRGGAKHGLISHVHTAEKHRCCMALIK